MIAVHHPCCNDVLAAPKGVSKDSVRALYIERVTYSDDVPAVRSYRRPTPDELAALNRGEHIMLSCIGHTHPPVALVVTP